MRRESNMLNKDFDVLVIGGGHAGSEAAHAAAKLGCATALITLEKSKIGMMSCNPAIGGLAKGQIVKEIDALGGIMGRITDLSAIQYRRLNASKGPAVRSSRAQCDKKKYALNVQSFLAGLPNLEILEGEVGGFIIEDHAAASISNGIGGKKVVGVRLNDGSEIRARTVVVTSGTFLRAIMHRGRIQEEGGRLGDGSAKTLSKDISALGMRLRRLKTGTPPRLHKDSIDWSKTIPQPGDEKPYAFSFYWKPENFPHLPQISCHLTYTNQATHDIIEQNLQLSAMYSGAITGVGPRYCPSIEDKICRFKDKDKHQLFLEPEGLDVDEVYINGVSTSLPQDVQEKFIRTIAGLENVKFIRYGYAVEYDAIDARQLKATLECKDIPGLFFAGQVNGTSGYEEAAGQGLVAGINAALSATGREEFILRRDDSYIGVMIDDLILKGSDEPYRMFTSRAEYRLILREDNADLRLSPKAIAIGMLTGQAVERFNIKVSELALTRQSLKDFYFYPNAATNAGLAALGLVDIKDKTSAEVLLRRPEITPESLRALGWESPTLDPDVLEAAEIEIKYAGYIQKDFELLDGVRKAESLRIPLSIPYKDIPGLSNEIKGRLAETRPENLGQASRIQGITPAAVATLMIYIKNQGKHGNETRIS